MERSTPIDMLLVEDDHADIYLVQRAVADYSPAIRLTVMSEGREVLRFLRKEPPFVSSPSPTLIILDLGLPECHGHTILTELRGMPEYQSTPVVVFSVNERAIEEPRCLALGANAYVQKSSNFAMYFGSIQNIMRHWLRTTYAPQQGRRATAPHFYTRTIQPTPCGSSL